MLGKLLKHEINATGRILLPLYLIMLLLSLVNRALAAINVLSGPLNIIKSFAVAAYVISILAALVVTFVIIIMRFYKNLMTDEGYLMFTLPAKPSQLINAKFIVALLWNVVSVIVVVASLFIVLATSKRIDILKGYIDLIFASLKSDFGSRYVLLTIEFILMIIVSVFQQILLIYVSIAIGHMFGNHKVLGSFAAYIALSTIMQIALTLILVIWAAFAGSSFEALDTLPQMIFPFTIIVSIIFSVLFYLATNYIFKRKLNLE